MRGKISSEVYASEVRVSSVVTAMALRISLILGLLFIYSASVFRVLAQFPLVLLLVGDIMIVTELLPDQSHPRNLPTLLVLFPPCFDF